MMKEGKKEEVEARQYRMSNHIVIIYHSCIIIFQRPKYIFNTFIVVAAAVLDLTWTREAPRRLLSPAPSSGSLRNLPGRIGEILRGI